MDEPKISRNIVPAAVGYGGRRAPLAARPRDWTLPSSATAGGPYGRATWR
jgi:hypothetical protein